jgi:holdfast attachment protein HfaA
MRQSLNQIALATLAATCGAALLTGAAKADGYSSMAAYNHPYGMAAGQETQAINPSIRDANGNLTVVNGQITSGSVSRQSGVQTAGASVSGSNSSGSGSNGSGGIFGGATAIGNSLNVVTYGSNNTVIVNSKQTNNGDQNANVSINGH